MQMAAGASTVRKNARIWELLNVSSCSRRLCLGLEDKLDAPQSEITLRICGRMISLHGSTQIAKFVKA